jgi:DNA-binding NarL/FixJ family response regulator
MRAEEATVAVDEIVQNGAGCWHDGYHQNGCPRQGCPEFGGAGDPSVGAARDVVLLLSRVPERLRRVRTLEHAGYRVTIPRQPVAWVVAHRPPVLVTDDTDAARRIRAKVVAVAPATACVVVVDDPTPIRYRELLASGTTALPASCTDEQLVQAVGAASQALACLPIAAARALAGAVGDRPLITNREASLLRALVSGTTVASLARTVGYSPREMYRVLGSVYARLGAENRTEALLRADRLGLLTPPEPGR